MVSDVANRYVFPFFLVVLVSVRPKGMVTTSPFISFLVLLFLLFFPNR